MRDEICGALDGRRWTRYEMRGARRDNAAWIRAMEEKRDEQRRGGREQTETGRQILTAGKTAGFPPFA